jgi:hypothetical protein
LRAGFFFAGFFFATAIVHPSFRAGWLIQFTLATSTRRSARIPSEMRTFAPDGKSSALFTHFPS